MDFNSLKDKVSNLTLYDLKAGVRQVQNGTRPSPSGHVYTNMGSGDELHRDGVQGARGYQQ
jgi:hypothetical protein